MTSFLLQIILLLALLAAQPLTAQVGKRVELWATFNQHGNSNYHTITKIDSDAGDLEVLQQSALHTFDVDVALSVRLFRHQGVKIGMGVFNTGAYFKGNLATVGPTYDFSKTYKQSFWSYTLSHVYQINLGPRFRVDIENGFTFLRRWNSDLHVPIAAQNWNYTARICPVFSLGRWRCTAGVGGFMALEPYSYRYFVEEGFTPRGFAWVAGVGYRL